MRTTRLKSEYFIALVFLLIGTLMVVAFFDRIPIEGTMLAVDWKNLYSGLQGGHIVYKGGSLMVAPWSLPAVIPLGFFSMRVGWGLLVMMTLGALIISVPRKGRRLDLLSIFLLTSSFLSIREVVDGNFEVLVISGVAITIYADRRQNFWLLVIGLLLATAKPQEVWLLMIVLGVYLLRTQTPQRLAKLAGALAIFVIPALVLVGFDWIGAMKDIQPPPGSILDISLWAALGRLGVLAPIAIVSWVTIFIVILYVAVRSRPTLSREKAGMLIAASLLLAPYAAGDSVLTVLAIGIIPLFQARPRTGLILIAFVDLQYVLPRDFLFQYSAFYWTAMLITCLGIWAWRFYQKEVRTSILDKESMSAASN